MTRYLVTGGAGFIGSHVVDRLLEGPEHEVVVLDNLSNSDLYWLDRHADDSRMRFVRCDILDTAAVTGALDGVEVVIHLASSVDMRNGLEDPTLDLRQCAEGTQSVLEAMRASTARTVVFSSSSAVYGDPAKIPTAEGDGPFLPISTYGAGKLAAEGLLSAYGHLHGFDAYAFRFGNVVGARMNHGVVYDFIAKLSANPTRLDGLGDGRQAKSYFLVEDCVAGLLTLPARLGPGSHVTNLGAEGTIEVSEIAGIVVREMGLPDVTVSFPGGSRGWPGDVPIVHFDLTKAHELGWQASADCAGAIQVCVRRLLAERTAAPTTTPNR